MDIKKAYDREFREGVWRRLWEAGVKGSGSQRQMWRVLKHIYASKARMLEKTRKRMATVCVAHFRIVLLPERDR